MSTHALRTTYEPSLVGEFLVVALGPLLAWLVLLAKFVGRVIVGPGVQPKNPEPAVVTWPESDPDVDSVYRMEMEATDRMMLMPTIDFLAIQDGVIVPRMVEPLTAEDIAWWPVSSR